MGPKNRAQGAAAKVSPPPLAKYAPCSRLPIRVRFLAQDGQITSPSSSPVVTPGLRGRSLSTRQKRSAAPRKNAPCSRLPVRVRFLAQDGQITSPSSSPVVTPGLRGRSLSTRQKRSATPRKLRLFSRLPVRVRFLAQDGQVDRERGPLPELIPRRNAGFARPVLVHPAEALRRSLQKCALLTPPGPRSLFRAGWTDNLYELIPRRNAGSARPVLVHPAEALRRPLQKCALLTPPDPRSPSRAGWADRP